MGSCSTATKLVCGRVSMNVIENNFIRVSARKSLHYLFSLWYTIGVILNSVYVDLCRRRRINLIVLLKFVLKLPITNILIPHCANIMLLFTFEYKTIRRVNFLFANSACNRLICHRINNFKLRKSASCRFGF